MFTDSSKIPNSKVSHEDTILFSVLKEELTCINVARLKLMSLFTCVLCKVQTVNYERLALGFDTTKDRCKTTTFILGLIFKLILLKFELKFSFFDEFLPFHSNFLLIFCIILPFLLNWTQLSQELDINYGQLHLLNFGYVF